ncbi:MAG: tryptophan-rich sensory protein, partial [Clostridia bacterium]|nr:tryptophan-rich sensory protein [Clostridia bacterium]
NLAVNFLWSIIFFNLRAFLFAFIWLLLLLAVVLAMIIEFRKIRPWTAYAQIPYFIWGLFALYLNIAIYVLN